MWTASVRNPAFALLDPVTFTSLTLVERYGPEDSLSLEGDLADLGPAKTPGTGIYVTDDVGDFMFSGWLVNVERHGDGTGALTYKSDTVLLWDRFCWPTAAAAWTAQTSPYDVQTASVEARILGYILRNAGSTAYQSGADTRRISTLRLPTSLNRGASAKTSARFQNLGQFVADLAESANLRVTIRQTYDPAPHLDVTVTAVPDLSGWAEFGDASSGALGMLDESWSYTVGAHTASVILSAAGGTLENRALAVARDGARETAWGRRVELFIDQRGTDPTSDDAAAGITQAMAENVPTVEVKAPIVAGDDVTFGDGAGQIPVGAKVAVTLDGETVVERIRQVTTTVQAAEGTPTVTVEPVFGSPDAGIPIDEKQLRNALKRLRKLESP